jgi:antitoxin HicB
MKKNLDYYLSLNYPIELTREGGFFVAAHPDLPGCVAQGDTADEAIANLDDAREAWIAVGLEDKQFIPEPLPEEFSGRLSLRMPRALHGALAHEAQRQGVSLGQFIVSALSGAVGFGRVVEQSKNVEVSELVQAVKELRVAVGQMVDLPVALPGTTRFQDQNMGLVSRPGSPSRVSKSSPIRRDLVNQPKGRDQ